MKFIEEGSHRRLASRQQGFGALLPEQGVNVAPLGIRKLAKAIHHAWVLADEQVRVRYVGKPTKPHPPAVHSVLLIAHHVGEIHGQAVCGRELGLRLPFHPAVVMVGHRKHGLLAQPLGAPNA